MTLIYLSLLKITKSYGHIFSQTFLNKSIELDYTTYEELKEEEMIVQNESFVITSQINGNTILKSNNLKTDISS